MQTYQMGFQRFPSPPPKIEERPESELLSGLSSIFGLVRNRTGALKKGAG
jgi:hypothetical protein